MERFRRESREGFTLVELMIVVTIVGILSTLAVFGVRTYVANAKSLEAREQVGLIAQDAVAGFEREFAPTTQAALAQRSSSGTLHQFCASAANSVPTTPAQIRGKKYQSSAADWTVGNANNSGWSCLKFTIATPQYYEYSYTVTGNGYTLGDSFSATAQGDLNGDGILSLFQLVGAIGNGRAINVAPVMAEVRAGE
jgi:type IV pilus assembly protein PilA